MSRERYLLSNDAPEAMDRFTAFTTLFDPATFRHLDGLGLAPGWRCWEVGAGGTSVVDYLSERVGPAGHVLATDINLSWAAGAVAPNVELLEHDIKKVMESELFNFLTAREYTLVSWPCPSLIFKRNRTT